MANNREYERRLEQRGVKPTALRLLIARTLVEACSPLSVSELEDRLVTVDKSTIFRTLTLFLARHLIHGLEDGSGTVKYEWCSGACACTIDDMHTHFYCEHCRRTFCFRQMRIPPVELPDGFVPYGINYMVKGLCPDCAAKQSAAGTK